MTAALIITVAMVFVWFYFRHRLQLPSGIGYSMDVAGKQWSFMWFYDRYRSIIRDVMWITVVAIAAAVYSHNDVAFYQLLSALIDSLLLQALMIFWYESFTHATYTEQGAVRRFVYTPGKYAAVLTMAVALPIYFFIGLALTAMMF